MTSPFPRQLKAFLLLLPVGFLLTAIVGSATGFLSDSRSYAFELFIILFATSPHGIFTLSMLRLPEMRDMITERTSGRRWLFWMPAIAIFGIGLFVFRAAQGSMPAGPDALILSQLLVTLLAYHHGIKQILGISLVYNSRLRREGNLSEEDLRILALSEKRERWCFHLFTPAYLLFLTFDLLRNIQGRPGLANLAKHLFVIPKTVVILMVVAILVNTVVSVLRTRDYEKLLYFSRLMLFAGAALGLPAVFMNGSLLASHATEYFGVYGTVQANSRTNQKVGLFVFAIALTAVLLPLVYLNHTAQSAATVGAALAPWLPLLQMVAAVEGGLALMHYYLDRQIFRARIPAVRKHVTRLFEPTRLAG